MALKLVIFDCDSTLSAIEGIDELARSRGPEVFAAVEQMTRDAMDGKISVESVFGRRLEIIRPRRQDVAAIGELYIQQVEPTAKECLAAIRARGWTPMILSGGFRQAIRPLADFLGIERVEAVDLFFDHDGAYTGFDGDFPSTRSGGKPVCLTKLRAELAPEKMVMIGDGVSDLETKPVVDLFVGFTRYFDRPKVRAGAHACIDRLGALPSLLP